MKTNRLLRIVRKCTVIVFLLVAPNIIAQTYPVQTNISTSGPYLNYLSYYGDDNNHLQLTVTQLDFNEPPILARLRIRIEGPGYELYTNPNATVGQPFLLEAGMPLTITGIDLLPYLQQSNLINPSGVDLNNLPHGFTTICVDVIRESALQQVLSTNNCGFLPIQEYQPPQTFIPTCGDVLDTNTMFHTFTWTPPVPFPAGVGLELFYDFSIYQWADPNNNSALNGNAILIYEETDLIAPTTQVSDFNVIFELGRTYVWKVTARVESNGMPLTLIENGGVSAPCTFIYGEAPTLNDVLSDGLEIELFTSPSSERKGKAWWTVTDNTPNAGLSTFDAYFVEYRKQPTGNEGFEIPWFSKTLSSLEHFIYQLEPSTTYEVKVSGIIAGTVGDPTPVETFTTPDARIYNCGESDVPYLPTNYTPLENATAGTQVKIGQFMMTMTEVTAVGSAGHYKGKGEIPIAFLAGAKAKVRFDDILIDTEYLVHEGRVDVITEGLANWLDDQYQQFIDPYFVEGTIDSAYVQDSVAWVVVDGVPQSFNFDPPNYPIIVNDESGNQYTIYPNGTVVVGTYLSVSETWSIAANEVVMFSQNDGETRGFDPKEHQEWHENYETMKLGDDSFYYVANKSLAKSEGDLVNVQFPPNVNHVRFELSNGDTIPYGDLQGSWMGSKPFLDSGLVKTLNLPSFSSSGKQEVYAFTNGVKIGQLNIHVYSQKDKEVIVVPLVANIGISDADIENELKRTLGEANIQVDVTMELPWTDSTGTFTASTNISMPSEVGMLTKYSDDMRGLRDAYFEQHPSAAKNKYYLFLVNGFDDPNEMGYMVRGRSMGFVKLNQTNILKTISHELGHGMGALEHTFKDEVITQGSTNNLMDYSGEANLTKAQWKELRDLDIAPSLFDEVEDASYSLKTLDYICIPDDVDLSQETIFKDLDSNQVEISGNYVPYAFVGGEGANAGAVSIIINTSTGVVYYPTNAANGSGYYGIINGSLNSTYHYKPSVVSSGSAIELNATLAGDYVLTKGTTILQSGTSTSIRSCSGLPKSASELTKPDFFEEPIFSQAETNALNTLDSAAYTQKFDEFVDLFVTKVNQASYQRQTQSYDYTQDIYDDYTGFKHIVNIGGSTHSPYSLSKKKIALLDQRLAYLKDYSKSKGKEVEIYVVTGDVDLVFEGSDWKRFAKEVYEKSNLAEKNALLVTIPTAHIEEQYQGFIFGLNHTLFSNSYHQVSFYGNATVNELAILKDGKFTNNNVDDFLFEVYRQTSKPLKIYNGYQTTDGTISIGEYEPSSYKTGYGFCKDFFLWRKPGHTQIAQLTIEQNGVDDLSGYPYSTLGDHLDYNVILSQLIETANTSDWTLYERNDINHLKEKFMEADKGAYLNYAFAGDFDQWCVEFYQVTQGISNVPSSLVNEDHWYLMDTWGVISPIVYGGIDAVSVGLSFVGLDVISEGFGLVVAAAAGDESQITGYAIAVLIPATTVLTVKIAQQLPTAYAKAKILFRGAFYAFKNGQWVKMITAFKYGKVLDLYKISDNLVTPQEINAFVNKFEAGEVSEQMLLQIKTAPTEVERVNLLKTLANAGGKTADEWLTTLKSLSYKDIRDHIFIGNFKKTNGCHYRAGVDNVNVRFENGAIPNSNSLGVLEGPIEMRKEVLKPGGISHNPKQYSAWKPKNTGGELQTFFPSTWSKDKILDECASALANPNKSLVTKPDGTLYSNMYSAESNSGVFIRWFEDSSGKVLSIFPEF